MPIKKNIVYGVTGTIASGKTFLCTQLALIAQQKKIPLHVIQVDEIRRYILHKSWEKKHIHIRNILAEHNVSNKNIFEKEECMKTFQRYVNPEIKAIIQQQIDHLDGIVLLERAMLITDHMQDLVDNLLFVSCSSEVQKERLKNSDIWTTEIEKRICYQNKQKIYPTEEDIQQKKWIVFDTSQNPSYEEYSLLFNKINNGYA